MNLHELLSKYRFTLKNETQLWCFVGFDFEYDHPIKMQRLEDRHIAYFKVPDLIVDSTQCETIDCEQLREQLKRAEKHHKEVEKQRLSEWQQLNRQLKMTSSEIDTILEFFDEMSIDLIKKKLKRLSGSCERASY